MQTNEGAFFLDRMVRLINECHPNIQNLAEHIRWEKIQSALQEEVFRITRASTAIGRFPLTINGFTSIA
jgi:hypothetical protein